MNLLNRHRLLPWVLAVYAPLLAGMPVLAEDWRLQPLAYNHSGLTVDLGVGLWAWPMPMDYDGDGDLDLLVACPDKPSNGIYFFENPTQDPGVAFPVFRPGVRLGGCSHNLQVSYVNGKARVLKPGFEFPRDEAGGFAFDRPKKIYAKTNIHGNRVRANMWRYVDFDGDGDHDLTVGVGDWTDYGWDSAFDAKGRWRNGPLHGYVYLLENQGDDRAPAYAESPTRLSAGGGDIDVYGWPSPSFADFDGDDDLDLVCGEFLDGFTYFENTGTRTRPLYAAGRRMQDDAGRPLVMDLQMVTPTAIDWDQDGDADLVVGDEDGRVALIEHTGSLHGGVPVFRRPVYFRQEADTLKFGALATPFAVDWDDDGDEDLLCGNTAGQIGIFENLGDAEVGLPRWAAPRLLEVDGRPFRVQAGSAGSIQGPGEAKWGYTTLSAADWDNDGDPDIVFNSILAQIGILRNDRGSLVEIPLNTDLAEAPPAWSWETAPSEATLTQWRTTPVATDFDGDGALDLVLLDQDGFLTLRRRAGVAERLFVDENNQPLRLSRRSCGASGRLKLAVTDWDRDGRFDLLVNSQNATWYRNCEDREGKVVLKRIGNLARRNVAGHTSSPTVCDFDRDGKPDLLIGAEDGRIYFIRHDDCVVYPSDALQARAPEIRPSPRFAGLVLEEFVFEEAPFPQCHASTLCETSRGLVVAWFGGTREKHPDVGIWVSVFDGENWSRPRQWADGIQHEGLRYPCWNPVLFQPPGDAPTLLFFKVGPTPSSWWGELMVSYDRGRTFRDRRRLPEGILGPVRSKPLLLANHQSLLAGSSTEHDGWRVHFEQVDLEGGLPTEPWRRVGPILGTDSFNAIQPTFLHHPDGRLQVLCRTQEGVLATSFSDDDGHSWSDLEATALPNNNAGIEAITLADGRFLLVYNHLGAGNTGWGRRGLLNLAISENGIEWRKAGVLEREEQAEFSYPAGIQTHDGRVHLTYTWKRSRIKHVVIDPSKLEPGEPLGMAAWD